METRTSYEESELEEEFTKEIAKQHNRRSKMNMKAQKPLPKQGEIKSPRASKVSKQTMIDAIVNLEQQVDKMLKNTTLMDDALRQYIVFKGDGDKFQEHLNKITAKRDKEFKKEQEKMKKLAIEQGLIDKDGKPIKPKSK